MRRLLTLIIAAILLGGIAQDASAQTFEQGRNKLWCYKDENGTEILPCQYAKFEYSANHDYIYAKDTNNKWGAYDYKGNLIVPHVFSTSEFKIEGSYVYVKPSGGKDGVYNLEGDIVLPHKYDVVDYQSNGIWRVSNSIQDPKNWKRRKDIYGFVNSKGEEIAFGYDEAGNFSEGLAAVKVGKKWGYIDTTGKTVINFQYKDAQQFSEGLAPVKKSSRYGYIDKDNNLVLPYKHKKASPFYNGMARVGKQAGYGWLLYALDPICVFVPIILMPYEIKYGYIDKNGNEIIPKKYKSAPEKFDEYGLAYVNKTNKYHKAMYIDKNNRPYKKYDDGLIALGIDPTSVEKNKFKAEYIEYKEPVNYAANTKPIQQQQQYQPAQQNQQQYQPAQNQQQAYYNVSNNAVASNVTLRNSDVDINIPKTTRSTENTFAVIIANEDYKRESKVEYAIADGEAFKEYCIKTLGLPETNVHLVTNAGLGDIKHEVSWMTRLGNVYGGDAKLIFYYAGHGIPDESSLSAYLLPVDGYGTDITTGYKLTDLYNQLAAIPSKSTIVLLDACFSGAERSGKMMASSRGVALKAKPATPKGNMVVLTAASGDETAHPYRDKGHGMFTYFLLKKLKETNGNATLGELYDYIKTGVARAAVINDLKDQSPTAIPAASMANTWKNITLY